MKLLFTRVNECSPLFIDSIIFLEVNVSSGSVRVVLQSPDFSHSTLSPWDSFKHPSIISSLSAGFSQCLVSGLVINCLRKSPSASISIRSIQSTSVTSYIMPFLSNLVLASPSSWYPSGNLSFSLCSFLPNPCFFMILIFAFSFLRIFSIPSQRPSGKPTSPRAT